jgi:hypothetical protein
VTTNLMIYPMAAMVLLTAFVLVRMYRSRVAAIRSGQIDVNYYRLHQGALEPEQVQKVVRHFANLFEAPTLFYVACLAGMVAGVVDTALLAIAWAYVAARYLHAFVHLGLNKLRLRRNIYGIGWLVLLVMWVYLVVKVAGLQTGA